MIQAAYRWNTANSLKIKQLTRFISKIDGLKIKKCREQKWELLNGEIF